MASVQRRSDAAARLRRGPADELRLHEQLAKLRAENRQLRRQVAELEELVDALDPDGERTYAWLFGIA